MASKADRFYFETFIAAAEDSCRAANFLVECLTHYEPEAIGVMLQKMHDYEHAADKKKHEMSTALAKAFVTPIDREDLAELSQNIDEVTDGVEEILQRFYVHRMPRVLPPTSGRLARPRTGSAGAAPARGRGPAARAGRRLWAVPWCRGARPRRGASCARACGS